MSIYSRLAEFFTRYEEPVIEDLTVGFSGIDPPKRVLSGEINHELLRNLLGGNEEGHYHLTKEELDGLRELLSKKYPPEIEDGQEIVGIAMEAIEPYEVKGVNVKMSKQITSVKWEATNLPAGLSINANTGVISGTPTVQPGTYTPTVKVTTNYGSDSKQITIIVSIPESWKPIIDPNQSVTVVADEAMTAYTVTGTNVTLS